MQEAVVAREVRRRGRVFGAQVKDVEGGGEEEGELQGRADRGEGVGGGVVRREDGDVEGVVLYTRRGRTVSVLCGKRERERERESKRTFRPITPRQAMDGIAVAMSV